MKKFTVKQIIGWILGVVVIAVFYLIPANELMTHEAWFAVGMLIGCVVWMLLGCLPEYAAMIVMCLGWVIGGCVGFTKAFSNFGGTSVWIVIGAMVIGVAGAQSGLLARLAFLVMKLFPASFKGQSIALTISGAIINPLIPSSMAKATIFSQIAKSISDAMGFEPNSRASTGIFMAFWHGFQNLSVGFLSASFISYTLVALQPEAEQVTWMQWFLYALPFTIFVGVAGIIVTMRFYKPEQDIKFGKDVVAEKYNALGPWTPEQKFTLVVLICCLVLWMTEQIHGVSACAVTLFAAVALIAVGLVTKKNFKADVAWDQVVFIGCFLGISTVFAELGINNALQATLGGVLSPVVGNLWLFIPLLYLVVFIARLAIVSVTAAATLFSVIMIPLGAAAGINSFIIVFLCYTASMPQWIFTYQQGNYASARAMVDDTMGTHGVMAKLCPLIVALSIVGCWVCIPFWSLLGLC